MVSPGCWVRLVNDQLFFFQNLNRFLLVTSVAILFKSIYVVYYYEMLYEIRVWWSLSICYIVFACLNGQSEFINWFLSHPRWQPISRLSFIMFLIHPTVMTISYAERQLPWYFSIDTQVNPFSNQGSLKVQKWIEINFQNDYSYFCRYGNYCMWWLWVYSPLRCWH